MKVTSTDVSPPRCLHFSSSGSGCRLIELNSCMIADSHRRAFYSRPRLQCLKGSSGLHPAVQSRWFKWMSTLLFMYPFKLVVFCANEELISTQSKLQQEIILSLLRAFSFWKKTGQQIWTAINFRSGGVGEGGAHRSGGKQVLFVQHQNHPCHPCTVISTNKVRNIDHLSMLLQQH